MKKVKILQILAGGSTFNGIASSVYQQFKSIDKNELHYDFYFTNQNSLSSVMDDPIFEDSRFIVVGAIVKGTNSNDYFAIYRSLRNYLKENEYDYIVVNSSVIEVAVSCLLASRKFHNTRFVAHAHNTGLYIKKGSRRNKIKIITDLISKIGRRYVRKNSAFLFGCSKDAISGTFGNAALNQNNIVIVRNAVEVEKFCRQENIRRKVRGENGTREGTIVFGNVGTLNPIKNQAFLIRVFSELLAIRPASELWIIGNGPERENLEHLAKNIGIEKKVIFFGQRMDVPELMQGMDAFIFTSLSEGLGIVAIEAQAAGLPTVISDGVPDEALITKLSIKIPLSKDPGYWAENILKHLDSYSASYDYKQDIRNAGYDSSEEGKKITDFYVANSVGESKIADT